MNGMKHLRDTIRVARLSLRLVFLSRRTIFLALLCTAPLLLLGLFMALNADGRLVVRDGEREAGATLFGLVFWMFYLRFIVPVLAASYGTGIVADEVENQTITYLFTRPVSRRSVLAGKYLAHVGAAAIGILPSLLLTGLLANVALPGAVGASTLLTDAGLLFLAFCVYSALFAAVGAGIKRPMLVSLIFVFGWEQLVIWIPGTLRRLTVVHYLDALSPHLMPETGPSLLVRVFVRSAPSAEASLLALGAMLIVFLFLAGEIVSRREYVLKQ